MTEDTLIDRVRTVLTGVDFDYQEAPSPFGMNLQPLTPTPVFRVTFTSRAPRGGTNYSEESVGDINVHVARLIDADFDDCRRQLQQNGRAILSAIVHDGAEVSGEYCVEDEGRRLEVVQEPKDASYLTLRLVVPVNFEAVL